MDEISYLERVYQLIRDYRTEVVITAMFTLNPFITYLALHRIKWIAPSALKRRMTNFEICGTAFVLSLGFNIPVAVRWGGLHMADAQILSVMAAIIAPTMVKGLMAYWKERRPWLYDFLRADRRKICADVATGADRRMPPAEADPEDTWGS